MKEKIKPEQLLKKPKAVFKLIKNENWKPPLRETKKRVRLVTDKDLPPAA